MGKTNGIYIAGPMSGIADFNHPAFNDAEKMLRSMGWTNIGNPAAWDKQLPEGQLQSDGGIEAAFTRGFDLRKVFLQDLTYLCNEASAIYMLHGWEGSSGSRAEHAVARMLRLDFIYQDAY